jgi:SAM-dependent methyltransferase
MLAARAGASVTGLDGSPRLIEVARARARNENVDAAFVVGDLHDIPFADGAFDLVVSVFGVIFASDPRAALAEVLRVLKSTGRALISVWEPSAVGRSLGAICGQALGSALGAAPPRFEWSDHAAMRQVAAELGATARFHDGGDIVFTADSPEQYLATQGHDHPLMIGARRLLEHAGTWDATHDQLIRAVRDQNEEPGAFRTTSRYGVIEIRHDSADVAAAAGTS